MKELLMAIFSVLLAYCIFLWGKYRGSEETIWKFSTNSHNIRLFKGDFKDHYFIEGLVSCIVLVVAIIALVNSISIQRPFWAFVGFIILIILISPLLASPSGIMGATEILESKGSNIIIITISIIFLMTGFLLGFFYMKYGYL